MRRVLMVSPHFPPDTSAAAHRVRLLAPYLAQHGWEPTVLTVAPDGYEGRLDPDLASLVPESLRVIRVPAWSAASTRRVGLGDLGLRAFTGLRRAAAALCSSERFDALFVTIYPTYPALLGPSLKRRFGVPFVLDYQDPWVGSWGRDVGPRGRPDAKSRVSRALAERLEPRVVRAADAITAVSARTYEDVLRRTGASPRACAAIPLGGDPGDFAALAARHERTSTFDRRGDLVHICYVGTLLPKGVNVVSTVLTALARLRDASPAVYARLRLHFLGTSNQRDEGAAPRVAAMAESVGVGEVVAEVPGRLDYFDALAAQRDADAILLLGSSESHYTPSKAYPALLSGRPLLAVYHQASPIVELLEGERRARVVTFDERHPVEERTDAVADALRAIVACRGHHLPDAADAGEVPWWSSVRLAGRLADVFDRVSA